MVPFEGAQLPRDRVIALRAVRPFLEQGPKMAAAVTGAMIKGFQHDPVIGPLARLLQWFQLSNGDMAQILRITRHGAMQPRGPFTMFWFLWNLLGLSITENQVALDD